MDKLFKKLNAFSRQAKKFEQHRSFFQNIHTELKFEQGLGLSTMIHGVNEENLISILVHFRNFYMKKNKLYFVSIANEIINEPQFQDYSSLTKDFLSAWNTILDPYYDSFGGMIMRLEKNSVSIKKNLDLWMNEEYLHVDQYKGGSRKGLDAIKSHPAFEALSKFGMVDTLQRLCGLIIAFNVQIIQKILVEKIDSEN